MRFPELRRRWFRLLVLATFFTVVLFWRSNGSKAIKQFSTHSTHNIKFRGASKLAHTDGYGFLSFEDAVPYCEPYGWKPYPKRDAPRKIYDLFLVNTEMDWLEIRLNELAGRVDYFVIVESATTFSGLLKPLFVKENWERFKPFYSQIIYHQVDTSGLNSTDAWKHEALQRDSMFDQVFPMLKGPQQPKDGDVILVSDLDELPRPTTLDVLRNCDINRRVTLRSLYYLYSFQWLERKTQWYHPQATYYEGNNTVRPESLRMHHHTSDRSDFWNASWHCTSCFATLKEMQNKVESFSHHTDWNTPEIRERSGIVHRVRHGLDPYRRDDEKFDRIEANTDLPAYLGASQQFKYMIDRDPWNANFKDYTLQEAEAAKADVEVSNTT